jgi:hypothetical protein
MPLGPKRFIGFFVVAAPVIHRCSSTAAYSRGNARISCFSTTKLATTRRWIEHEAHLAEPAFDGNGRHVRVDFVRVAAPRASSRLGEGGAASVVHGTRMFAEGKMRY